MRIDRRMSPEEVPEKQDLQRMVDADWHQAVDVFYGELTPQRGRIYVRAQRPAERAGWQLAGYVDGPQAFARPTLAARYALRDLGPGPELLAEALVLDPCPWAPENPYVYRVIIELQRNGQPQQTLERIVGLRNLGVSENDLRFDGQRWVLRGVCAESTYSCEPASWPHESTTLVADEPGEAICRGATDCGVLLVARLRGAPMELTRAVARLSRWPAVGLVVLEPNGALPVELPSRVPNLLLAQPVRGPDMATPAPWAHVAWCEATRTAEFARVAATTSRPVVAVRPLAAPRDMVAARAACDELQRDLAGTGRYAGYVV